MKNKQTKNKTKKKKRQQTNKKKPPVGSMKMHKVDMIE